MDWKRRLREEGFLEIPGFRIELTLDNTLMGIEYVPRIIVYDEETERWYVLRNEIHGGRTFEEGWENAVSLLERILSGEEPALIDEGVADRFLLAIRKHLGKSP